MDPIHDLASTLYADRLQEMRTEETTDDQLRKVADACIRHSLIFWEAAGWTEIGRHTRKLSNDRKHQSK